MKFNKEQFIKDYSDWFRKTKKTSFKGVQSLKEILTFVECDDDWVDIRQLANFLSQISHETAFTFKPLKEFRAREGTVARRVQDKYWNSGYFGKGIIQLTHKYNYEKLGIRLNIPLAENPDMALEPTYSYEIAAVGMREGLFTGLKLSDFINDRKCDYYSARRIVNGLDKATEIQAYSVVFERIIKDNLIIETASDIPSAIVQNNLVSSGKTPEDLSVKIEQIEAEKPSGLKTWWTTIVSFVGSLGIGGTTVMSVLQGLINEKYAGMLLQGGIALIILSGLVLIVYMIIRQISAARKEKYAHELNIRQLDIRADPELYNVELVKKDA